MDELLQEFIVETNESLDVVDIELVRLEQEPNNLEILRTIFRLVHTIKGTCGFLGLPRLETLAHSAETLMGQFRDGRPVTSDAVSLILTCVDRIKAILRSLEKSASEPEGDDTDLISELDTMSNQSSPTDEALALSVSMPEQATLSHGESSTGAAITSELVDTNSSASTLRVSVETLERLLTMVSELVLTRNQLLEISRQRGDHGFNVPLQRLSQITGELQDAVMQTRMQPIGNAWHKLPRVVRDVATELGKDIALVLHGAETELDRQVLELIKDPLTHMVRNAADHGIEMREDRIALGKPPRGTIKLSAVHTGGTITIEVSDDGRGIDIERIKAKAIARHLASETELERMTDAQIARFVFQPGFSTADTITAISGRGVGLDVVKANIELIGGSIDIRSKPHQGTQFVISLPLTLAIVPALLVGIGKHRFAIPQTAVMELVLAGAGSEARIETLNGGRVLALRNQLLPLVSLCDMLDIHDEQAGKECTGSGFVVILSVGTHRFGIEVDQVLHTEEIVVKPMSSRLRHISLFSGNTILGDGAVVLILEPNGLARTINGIGENDTALNNLQNVQDTQIAQASAERSSLLLFRLGERGQYAVPLSSITRLEEIETSRIERSGGRNVIQYRDRLMPLICFDQDISNSHNEKHPVLVVTYENRTLGIIIDDIIDVVEETITIDMSGAREGILGSTILRGEATDMVDTMHFIQKAYPDLANHLAADRRQRSTTALMIDGSTFFRDLITPVLRGSGLEIITVNSARKALQMVSEKQFDLILIAREDTDMPALDAIKALRKEVGAQTALVTLSADFDPQDRTRCLEAGAMDVVSKFDRTGLIELVQAMSSERKEAA